MRIAFCHLAADPNLALKVLNKLLVALPRLVPSGMKLMVTNWELDHLLPDAAYIKILSSRTSKPEDLRERSVRDFLGCRTLRSILFHVATSPIDASPSEFAEAKRREQRVKHRSRVGRVKHNGGRLRARSRKLRLEGGWYGL